MKSPNTSICCKPHSPQHTHTPLVYTPPPPQDTYTQLCVVLFVILHSLMEVLLFMTVQWVFSPTLTCTQWEVGGCLVHTYIYIPAGTAFFTGKTSVGLYVVSSLLCGNVEMISNNKCMIPLFISLPTLKDPFKRGMLLLIYSQLLTSSPSLSPSTRTL